MLFFLLGLRDVQYFCHGTNLCDALIDKDCDNQVQKVDREG